MPPDAVAVGGIALAAIGVVGLRWGWYARRRRATRSSWLGDLGAGAAIVAIAVITLLAMGRTPTYRHGPLRLWSGDVHSDQNSQQLLDPYTLTHVTHGVAFYALLHLVARRWPMGARGVAAVAIESAWEVLENTDAVIDRYRAATIARGYYGDSVVNAVMDILATVIGFALAAGLPLRATVAVTAFLEAALVLWIRDSLLLNVLMLVWPVDAIKAWQSAS
jgi:hypothetical protein